MRGHRTNEHQAAVSRRLALLSAELAAVRAPDPDPASEAEANPWAAPATHTRIAADRRGGQRPWREPPAPTRVRPGADDEPRRCRCRDGTPGAGIPPGSDRWRPEALRGRVSLGAPQVAVVLVLVAVGLTVTAGGWCEAPRSRWPCRRRWPAGPARSSPVCRPAQAADGRGSAAG